MIYEIEIKGDKVVNVKNEEEELERSGLKLVNFLIDLEGAVQNYTHSDLDAIQEYYNKTEVHCCWNYAENDFCEEDGISYARITINGETRYYEEW